MKDEFDVVVLGGGMAGVSAAMAAKEEGAKTLLVEQTGQLGGMVTGAYVIAMCGMFDGKFGKEQVVKGNFSKIAAEAIDE